MNTIMPTQKTKKLALMGFGNAGRAFAKLLIEKHKQIEEKSIEEHQTEDKKKDVKK